MWTQAWLSRCGTWVSGSCRPWCRVAEQVLSFEIRVLRLQLFSQSPNLQKLFQDLEASVHTYYLANIELSEVTNWPGLCIDNLVVQGYIPPTERWHGCDSSKNFIGGLPFLTEHRSIYRYRPSGMSHLHLNMKFPDKWYYVCTSSTDSMAKKTWWEWGKLEYILQWWLGYLRFTMNTRALSLHLTVWDAKLRCVCDGRQRPNAIWLQTNKLRGDRTVIIWQQILRPCHKSVILCVIF